MPMTVQFLLFCVELRLLLTWRKKEPQRTVLGRPHLPAGGCAENPVPKLANGVRGQESGTVVPACPGAQGMGGL